MGKRVIMIDDSIVRGTTCKKIVAMLRDAGAREIHMRIGSPPFLWPCYYGTDVPSRENLLAYARTEEEIRDLIGADSLGFLRIEDLPNLLRSARTIVCRAERIMRAFRDASWLCGTE